MKKNQQLSWDDFLFENRHKAYGAYALRTEEGNNLLKSLLVVIFIVGILITVLSFTAKNKIVSDPIPTPTIHEFYDFPDEVLPPKKEEPVAKKAIPVATVGKKDNDEIPEPKDEPKVEKPLTIQKDLGKVVMPGTGSIGGEGTIKSGGSTVSSGTGTADEHTHTTAEEPKADENIYSPRVVTKMAVFPGCENASSSKKALQDCMAEKLSNELGIQLSDFGTIASRNNIQKAQTKLNFIVDKSGKIVEIKAMDNDQTFSKEAREALKRISERLAKKGKYLKPAELDDGTKVNMSFTIPIQFQAQ